MLGRRFDSRSPHTKSVRNGIKSVAALLGYIIYKARTDFKNDSQKSDNNHSMDLLEGRMEDWQPC